MITTNSLASAAIMGLLHCALVNYYDVSHTLNNYCFLSYVTCASSIITQPETIIIGSFVKKISLPILTVDKSNEKKYH